MKKYLLLFLTLSLVFAGTSNASANSTVKGAVTFAPLCPGSVSHCTAKPNYSGRYVEFCRKIYSHIVAGSAGRSYLVCDDSHLISAPVNSNGTYSVSLPSSTNQYNYYVDFTLQGIEKSSDVPTLISLSPAETRIFNINVDTGLR